MRPEFKVHKLNASGICFAKAMGEKYSELMEWLENEAQCHPGRELSIAKTKLEESCFFAKKAMAVNPKNQIEE